MLCTLSCSTHPSSSSLFLRLYRWRWYLITNDWKIFFQIPVQQVLLVTATVVMDLLSFISYVNVKKDFLRHSDGLVICLENEWINQNMFKPVNGDRETISLHQSFVHVMIHVFNVWYFPVFWLSFGLQLSLNNLTSCFTLWSFPCVYYVEFYFLSCVTPDFHHWLPLTCLRSPHHSLVSVILCQVIVSFPCSYHCGLHAVYVFLD